MAQDKRKLLDVLKFELDFLEKGGYRERPHASWRSHFFFEDSPTCLNLSLAPSERACPECILIQLVPADRQLERFPCQHIRLNERSETLDSLSCSTQQEIEAGVASWLRTGFRDWSARMSQTRLVR